MAGYQPEVSASGWFAIGLFDIAVKARQGRPIAVLDPTGFTGQQPFEAPQASYGVGPSGVDAIGIDAISPATAGQSKVALSTSLIPTLLKKTHSVMISQISSRSAPGSFERVHHSRTADGRSGRRTADPGIAREARGF
jgi:hypothetical protein